MSDPRFKEHRNCRMSQYSSFVNEVLSIQIYLRCHWNISITSSIRNHNYYEFNLLDLGF